MDSHDEMGCQAPERPILCINNCGFFGRESTMNMCSKCYKDTHMKQEQEKLAVSSIDSIVYGTTSSESGVGKGKDPVALDLQIQTSLVETREILLAAEPSDDSSSRSEDPTLVAVPEPAPKQGPTRCTTCRKRVGLTGFKCRCENFFCAAHRYSDKHDCPFDYRTAGRDAISKANPVIKAEKLDKI